MEFSAGKNHGYPYSHHPQHFPYPPHQHQTHHHHVNVASSCYAYPNTNLSSGVGGYGAMVAPAYEDSGRKRQRRQTAGALMQNLFTGGRRQQQQQSPVVPSYTGSCSVSSSHYANSNTHHHHHNHQHPSTAKPRPPILIEARAIGPVREFNCNDVLCGRGGRINSHPGNIQFREVVQERKKEYLSKATKKLDKAHIAADIVYHVRCLDPPGRFLKEDEDGAWYDVGDYKAIKKVGQALREDASEARKDEAPEASASKDEAPEATTSKDAADSSTSVTGDTPAEPVKSTTTSAPSRSKSTTTTSTHQRVKRAVTVSGRGAKKITISVRQPSNEESSPYEPLAYQPLAPPAAYQSILSAPSTIHQPPPTPPPRSFHFPISFGRNRNKNIRNTSGGGASAVSGAAAAIMQQSAEEEYRDQQELYTEEAFGRMFHPADPVVREAGKQATARESKHEKEGTRASAVHPRPEEHQKESSQLSLKESSVLSQNQSSLCSMKESSVVSDLSNFSDRSHKSNKSGGNAGKPRSSVRQLDQLRHLWAQGRNTQQQSNSSSVPKPPSQATSTAAPVSNHPQAVTLDRPMSVPASLSQAVQQYDDRDDSRNLSDDVLADNSFFHHRRNSSLFSGRLLRSESLPDTDKDHFSAASHHGHHLRLSSSEIFLNDDLSMPGAQWMSELGSAPHKNSVDLMTMEAEQQEVLPSPLSVRKHIRRHSLASAGSSEIGGSSNTGNRFHVNHHNAHGSQRRKDSDDSNMAMATDIEGAASVMSYNSASESISSMPGSIMSDISETLIALDLAAGAPS